MAHEWQSIYKNSKQVLDTVGFWPCNVFTVQRLNTMAGLAAGGFGVGFTQSTYLAEFPHLSELNIYSILEKPLYTTFCAVYKKGKTLPLSAEILIHLMEQYVQPVRPCVHGAILFRKIRRFGKIRKESFSIGSGSFLFVLLIILLYRNLVTLF